jgi:hypothetical protein
VLSVVFEDLNKMMTFAASSFSICYDFLLRVTGRSNIQSGTLENFPFLGNNYLSESIVVRGLRLVCVTSGYIGLWETVCTKGISSCCWASLDHRLVHDNELPWAEVDPKEWIWKTPLRSDYARRQALLEIDVLVAMAFGLTIDELLTIYQVQFPVMRMYELADQFDARGRRIRNTIRKDQGGTEFRTARALAAEHFPEAYKTRPASNALRSDWPFADETSIPLDQAKRIPDIPEFASIHRYVAALRKYGDQRATLEPEEPNTDGPPSPDFTPHRIRQLESVYGPGRVPLMLDVSWEIDDGLQTVTKTFYPPFTKVDREEDYRRAWEEFSKRYAKVGG